MLHYVCNKDVVHNGTSYKKGQCWDGDLPAPQVGGDWTIRQDDEQNDPHRGSVGASALKGYVQWKPQPARARGQPLSSAEQALAKENPYVNLDEPAAVPDQPLLKKKQQPAPVAPFEITQEEIDDPYGLKARAAAREAELQAEMEKKDVSENLDKEELGG